MIRETCDQVQGFPNCMGAAGIGAHACTCAPAELRRLEREHLVDVVKASGIPFGIVVECVACRGVINGPAALLVGPPDSGGSSSTANLCARCHGSLLRTIRKRRPE